MSWNISTLSSGDNTRRSTGQDEVFSNLRFGLCGFCRCWSLRWRWIWWFNRKLMLENWNNVCLILNLLFKLLRECLLDINAFVNIVPRATCTTFLILLMVVILCSHHQDHNNAIKGNWVRVWCFYLILTFPGGSTRSENDHTFGPKFAFQNRTLTVHFFKVSRP